MFDSQCDLAALVYEQDQNPDKILHDFASNLNASGYRAVGLVQLGHHCLDAPKLSAMRCTPARNCSCSRTSAHVRRAAGWMSVSCWMPARKSPARSIRAPIL
jgi:hypothetical protein